MFKKPLKKPIQVGKLTVPLPHLSLITKAHYTGKDVQLQERGRKHIVCPVGKKGHSADLHAFWPHLLQLLNTPYAYGQHPDAAKGNKYENRIELYYKVKGKVYVVILQFNPETPQYLNILTCYELQHGNKRLNKRINGRRAFLTSKAADLLVA